MPRQYSSSISKYLISNNHTLQEYRKDLNYALDQLTDTTTPISVDVATNNEALKDRYGTKNTLTITIEEVYDETSKTYYTDYAIEHVKIDGIVQKLMEEIQVNNSGKKTYVYTLIYDVTHDATIDIVFKRVYGVNVKV